ncbi:MAG: XTP/dITP diphosphatase [Clostridiales bacterium]|nr:XTP/dITP diphosphatase [Clostridiales bacterium]MDU1042797.1 XTP/dITP diphosphatase [Clostridiales bacterium]
MEEIILATNNDGKVREFKEMLSDTNINIIPLKEAGIKADIEETGDTFKENALIKARAICKLTGKPALADDSGLSVDALNGEPGVYSARYLGEDTSYEIKNKAIIDRLEGKEGEERAGGFICFMALVLPDGREYITSGEMRGLIAKETAGENGFGYDPIVFLPEHGKTSAQLEPEVKNSISHRGEALEKMISIIKSL